MASVTPIVSATAGALQRIQSGDYIAVGALGSGTPSSTTVLLGDGTWASTISGIPITGSTGAFTTLSSHQHTINTGSANNVYTAFTNAGTGRWVVGLRNSETGSNAGSDLCFDNYNDAGAQISTAFTFKRSDGTLIINSGTANGVAYLNGSKVLTTWSGFTYNGATLTVGGAGGGIKQEDSTDDISVQIYSDSSSEGVIECFQNSVPTTKKTLWINKYGGGLKVASNFVFDGTNLGIGVSPSYKLDIAYASLATHRFLDGAYLQQSNSAYQPQINQSSYHTSNAGNYWISVKSRGTIASPSAASNGDVIANYLSQARNAAGTDKNVANIYTIISAAESSNEFGGTIVFETSAAGVGLAERMRLNSTGLGIGVTPSYKLDVRGGAGNGVPAQRWEVDGGSGIYVELERDSGGGGTATFGTTGSHNLSFKTVDSVVYTMGAGAVAVTQNSTGLGIGTSPSVAFHNGLGASVLATNSSIDPDSYTSRIVAGNIADGSGWSVEGIGGNAGTGDSWGIGHNGTNLYFGIQNGSAANTMATWMEVSPSSTQLTLNSTGLGVGTSPSYIVDAQSATPVMRIAASASGAGYIQYGKSATATNNWHVGSQGDGNFYWWSGDYGSGSLKMTLDSTGINSTVIGATTPAAGSFTTLSATGNITTPSDIIVTSTGASGPSGGRGLYSGTNDGAAMSSGDRIGYVLFRGAYDASSNFGNSVLLSSFTEENWSSTARGADFRIETTAAGGTTRSAKLLVTGDGRVYGTALHNNAGAVTGTTNQYIASGTYTPTRTNVNNITSSSAGNAQWMRVGNVVTVSGSINVRTSGANAAQVALSLPIASNLTATGQASGAGGYGGDPAGHVVVNIYADATNDRVDLLWTNSAASGAEYVLNFIFQYVVL